MIKLSVAST